MSSPPQNHSWYDQLNCPQFFDFSSVLTAPCSRRLDYNPPLHESVYKSDPESEAFFRNAAASLASPLPRRTMKPISLLEPGQIGRPTYRHRPSTTFEEFLRTHESQTQDAATAQLNPSSSKPSPSSADLPVRTKRDTSLHPALKQLDINGPSYANNDSQIPRTPALVTSRVLDPEQRSIRRTAFHYSPRNKHDSIVKSLFSHPQSPEVSPSRKARRNPRSLRDFPNRVSIRNTNKTPSPANASLASRAKSSSGGKQIRPPSRITTPEGGDNGSGNRTRAGLGTSKTTTPEENCKANAHRANTSGSGRKNALITGGRQLDNLRKPLRIARPSGSSVSTSSLHCSPASQDPFGKTTSSGEVGETTNLHKKPQNSPPIVPSIPMEASDDPQLGMPASKQDENENDVDSEEDFGEMDPDLLKRLREHNRRLQTLDRLTPHSRMNPAVDVLHESSTEKCGGQDNNENEFTPSKPKQCSKSVENRFNVEGKPQATGEPGTHTTLQALLNFGNNRVLQDRKHRQPALRKAQRLRRENALNGLRGPGKGEVKRIPTKTEVTASQSTTTNTALQTTMPEYHNKGVSNGISGPPKFKATSRATGRTRFGTQKSNSNLSAKQTLNNYATRNATQSVPDKRRRRPIPSDNFTGKPVRKDNDSRFRTQSNTATGNGTKEPSAAPAKALGASRNESWIGKREVKSREGRFRAASNLNQNEKPRAPENRVHKADGNSRVASMKKRSTSNAADKGDGDLKAIGRRAVLGSLQTDESELTNRTQVRKPNTLTSPEICTNDAPSAKDQQPSKSFTIQKGQRSRIGGADLKSILSQHNNKVQTERQKERRAVRLEKS